MPISIRFPKERAIWYSNMICPWCPGAFTTIPAIRLGFPDVGPNGWTQQGRGERNTFRLRIINFVINNDNDSFLLGLVLDFSRKQHSIRSYLVRDWVCGPTAVLNLLNIWVWKTTHLLKQSLSKCGQSKSSSKCLSSLVVQRTLAACQYTRPRFPDSGGNTGNAFALRQGHPDH